MIWILLSFLAFPFLVQLLTNSRKPITMSRIPGRISGLIFTLNLRLPKKIQTIEVRPRLCVWNASVVETQVAVLTKANHIHNMRVAYLANGKVGLIEYVSQYMVTSESQEKLEQYILNLEV